MDDEGAISLKTMPLADIAPNSLESHLLEAGDLLISRSGTCGIAAVFPGHNVPTVPGAFLIRFRLHNGDSAPFYRRYFNSSVGRPFLDRLAVGGVQKNIKGSAVLALVVPAPPLPEQRKIAEVLETVDEAIRKTEQIIAKLRQVKQGLLHDLLTRGIGDNGELRDPDRHPEQFKDSPLGRIPKGWAVQILDDVLESAVDGPFGSNLKTQHYVEAPGVRVVRLQNIGVGKFLDHEKAWVSARHASSISRHEVRSGDFLVACLGDPTHPFARSCLYPPEFPPGIVKADCFRLRPNHRASALFLSDVLNTPRWRRGLAGLVHRSGVSRDRINLGKLRRLMIPLPPVAEQQCLGEALEAMKARRERELRELGKLRLLKQGIMEDLLTGRVRVNPLLERTPQ